jgi:hypothetical protein
MAVERENAVINNQITLRNNFRFTSTNDLFDPYAISKVEILDSDGSTVLQTLTGASIVKDFTGKYHVVAAAIATAKTIYDKWYFTPASGATEITRTNICIVWETAAAAGEVVLETTDAAMLTAVKQAIAARLSGGAVQSYSIGGRNLQYCTLDELWKLRRNLEKKINNTAGSGRTYVKFIKADD